MSGVISTLKALFGAAPARKASKAWPKASGSAPAFDLKHFAERHPWWTEAPELRELTAQPIADRPWRRLKPPKKHGFFAPWLDQILATAAPAWSLVFKGGRPRARSTRSGGDVAWLSCPWPECGTCKEPLELVLQLQLHEVAPLFKQQGSVSLFYCFHCKSRTHEDLLARLTGMIRWERPEDRCDERRPTMTADGKPPKMRKTLRVDRRAHLSFPPAAALEGPLAEELFNVLLNKERLRSGEVYEKWTATSALKSQVGGYPAWQRDARPSCEECGRPMRLFFQVAKDAGFEFPEGANAYLFFCDRRPDCRALKDLRLVLQ